MEKVDDEEEWGERKGQVSHERGIEIGRWNLQNVRNIF